MSSPEVIGQVAATDVDTLNVNVDTASHPAPPPPPPWQLIDLQDCLHDSPQFRRMLSMKEQELNDLERKLEKIVTTCSTMVDSGQIYRENCRLFSLSLKELSEHFTELPSVKDAFARFCEIFNEIQTYYRVLFDQAQRTVMKGLKDFLTGDLRKVHSSQKSFHKTSAELSYVLHKNATTSRQKLSEADEMGSLLQTMQVEFTHQALDYCYQMNVVSCLKCHRITEKLVSFLGATSTFFHQGRDSLKCLDPYLREVVQEMDELQTQSTTDINYMRNRHSLVSSQHMQEDFTEIPMDNISLPIVFRGYLFKRSHNAFKSWNRRYCELRDNKLFYLKKNSEDDYGTIAEDLRLCTVKLADDLERRFCFEVVTPRRSCMLQADSEMDRRKWCMYLEAGIARALRVTSSNKSRELRRRLTSTAISTLAHAAELSIERLDSPTLHRTDSPTSVVSNASCSFDFLDVPGNEFCADCSRAAPKWASLNIGILLCIDCSGIHRSLGVHISKVRSTTLDDWEPEHQKIMSMLGNDRVNSIYEFEVPSYVRKPTVTTSASDREEYIKMKYVDRAFVHPHPNFNRPTVPIPPPRIQGTLLRAAVTSPKLAGRLNRPISMSTGLSLDQQLSPAASPVPSSRSPLNSESGESSPLGGLNLRPESMALLEENWRKLEKNGRLQQWNLKSMYNVVKSPRKTFNLAKFARPGSFRRKKSPLVSDDYSHSDNELEDTSPFFHTTQSQSHSVSPNLPYAPQKPPRTYTTTLRQIESAPGSNPLFQKEGDDFSSDLLSTLDRLGSVYSISGLLKEEMDGNDDCDNLTSHHKIQRSVSVQLQPPQNPRIALPVPKIAVVSNSFEGEIVIEEDSNQADTHLNTSTSSLGRELSRSVGSLPSLDIGNVSISTARTQYENEEVQLGLSDDHNEDVTSGRTETLKDRTLRNIDLSQYLHDDDDSSVDSYQSAEDRNDLMSRFRSDDSPLEIKRPDSEASELFHTPPNSPSPSPTGLESISPSHITNIGLALGVNITLQDSQSNTKLPDTFNQHALGDLTMIGGDLHNPEDEEDEEGTREDDRPLSSDKSIVENDSPPPVKDEPSLKEEAINNPESPSTADASSIQADADHDSSIAVDDAVDFDDPNKTSAEILYNSECVDPYSEYDVHIIPDDISPSKFLFECSLNGDLGGILSGIAHGGLINQPITEEGNKYPIHQACITGNETTMEFLYQNGAKLNVADNRGCTPLHLLAMNGYVSLVAILLKHGVDHTILDKEGKTSLMYATARENADIVAILKLAEAGDQLETDECYEEDTKMLMEESVAVLLHKNSPEVDSIKSRSLSSTNSSSSTDKVNSGSELSMCSVNKVSDLVLNSKSKQDT